MGSNEWILVKDRLPEKGQIKRYPHCSKDVIATDGHKVYLAYYEGENWQDATNDLGFTTTITHWQPLPEPPKTNTNEI